MPGPDRRARAGAAHSCRWRVPRLRGVVLGAVLAGGMAAVLAACSGDGTEPAGPRSPTVAATGAGPDLAGADLWLSFEEETIAYDGSPTYADARGGPPVGRVVVAQGGAVRPAPGADGSASSVAFPERCTSPTGCPRALVEVAPSPLLDPGERDFSYGATVWLAPDQATGSSNIVQKGRFGSSGGQWKLQVDSEDGLPSCLVRSGDDTVLVRSGVSVADSRWHRVVCRRDASGVTIEVDGVAQREEGRTGSVSNAHPVRIGSPGLGPADDQFHGRLDDVFLDIEP